MHLTLHTMRHNFITMCWEASINVLLALKIAGYADYRTTMDIYTHLFRKHLDKAKSKMNEMFSPQVATEKNYTKVAQAGAVSLPKEMQSPEISMIPGLLDGGP